MAGNLHFGLWQQTSEQAVRQRQQQRQQSSFGAVTAVTAINTGSKTTVVTTTDAVTSAAGTKRRHESGGEASLIPPPAKKRAALPSLPARLAASAIDEVVSIGAEKPSSATSRPSWLAPGSSEYSQRRVISATPTAAANPMLSLAHPCYDLPAALVANLAALGIRSIYPWQMHCLLGHRSILAGKRNLVYAAPTGGGKSLVADVLMLRQVLQSNDGANLRDFRRRPKALLVLPFVALVQEKVRWLRRIVAGVPRSDAQSTGSQTANGPGAAWQRRPAEDTVRVVGFFGGAKIRATWTDFDIGVATIEKANALINTAIDDGTISDLKVIVLDELHMVDDSHRGYIYELMATKLLCLDHSVQIVGMSATLSNMELLATWLRAYSYETRYRPIPIEEHIVHDGEIHVSEEANRRFLNTLAKTDGMETAAPARPLRKIQPSGHRELHDSVTNAVVSLANETARSGYGALVFSSSRAASESDALLISRVMPTPAEVDPAVSEPRLDLVSTLRSLSTGLDSVLSQTVPVGVAFHHAGMTTEERDLIASAYDDGVLKVCVATCGLAAGINLPARRVILHNARMGRELIGPAMLRQMRGRAGRKGKDEVGETYLCCRGADVDDMLDLMHAELPHVSSCLQEDKRRLQRALLEVITVRLATSPESVHAYVEKTLLYHSVVAGDDGRIAAKADLQPLWMDVETSLGDLQRMGFVSKGEFGDYEPTRFGKAVVASALDPEDAVFIHGELERALKAFVLDGEMHVLYTFTPVHDTVGTAINWRRFWEEMEQLDESGLRVLRFLGLKPSIISTMLRGGTLKESTPEEKGTARIYRRFYLALQLRDLCNEMPIHRVAQKYDTPRGAVQNLAQTCEGFAAGMIKFCEHMDWGAMASVLEHFVDRLKAGAKADLLALAKIAFIKSRTARVFWENGFKTVATVANADPRELVPVLMQAQASKVLSEDRNDDKYQEKLLEKARIITESANRIWQLEMQTDLGEE